MSSLPAPDSMDFAILRTEAVELMMRGEYAAALREFETLLAHAPKSGDTHAGLAWLLATCPDARFRDGARAVEHARAGKSHRAYLVLRERPGTIVRVLAPDEVLAAALAETWDFTAAIKAVDDALLWSRPPERPRLWHLRRLFAAGKPYRDTSEARQPTTYQGAEQEYRAAVFGIRADEPPVVAPSGEEAAFVRAVLDAPEDDAPLLMYADWLSERGDLRGEFIRLSVELLQRGLGRQRRDSLLARRAEILTAHGIAWFRPLAALGLHLRNPWDSGMERGVRVRVRLERTGVLPERADALFAAVPLLTAIDFDYEDVDAVGLAGVVQLSQVRRLAFREDALDRPGLETLLGSPHLARLAHLQLGGHRQRLRGEAVEVLEASPLAPTLRGLGLAATDAGPEVVGALSRTTRFRCLEILDLSRNNLDRASVGGLATWATLAGVTDLNLELARLNARDVAILATSPHLRRLRKLNLGLNKIGDAAVASLVRAPALAGLEELELCSAELGPEAARLLAGAPSLAGLRSLQLLRNDLGPEGAAALAASPYLRNLERLWVVERDVGAEGMDILQRRFGDVLGA
jgi:uncharacterized protein (TIGR02996 family)